MSTSARTALTGSVSVALLLVLAACGGDGAGTPAAQQAPAAPAADGAADLPWTLDEARLADGVLQARRESCESEPYVAEISWTLEPAHGPKPEIWVASEGQPLKLWVAPSQRAGVKQTGNWLMGTSVLYLVDATTQTVIARLRMGDVACGTPAAPANAEVGAEGTAT